MRKFRDALQLLLHPVRAVRYVLSRYLYVWVVRRKHGVQCSGRLHLREFPVIEIAPGAQIEFGDDVKLNSRREGYHVNMFAPVRLVASRMGARITVGARTRIHGTCVNAERLVSIGSNCLIAANTQIFDSSGHDLSFDDVSRRIETTGEARPVIIGDSVWIGTGALVLPGVTIGSGAVIAAGSVVTKNVPARCLAGGNPARVIRRADEHAIVKARHFAEISDASEDRQ